MLFYFRVYIIGKKIIIIKTNISFQYIYFFIQSKELFNTFDCKFDTDEI